MVRKTSSLTSHNRNQLQRHQQQTIFLIKDLLTVKMTTQCFKIRNKPLFSFQCTMAMVGIFPLSIPSQLTNGLFSRVTISCNLQVSTTTSSSPKRKPRERPTCWSISWSAIGKKIKKITTYLLSNISFFPGAQISPAPTLHLGLPQLWMRRFSNNSTRPLLLHHSNSKWIFQIL